jgi:hypothetical protein
MRREPPLDAVLTVIELRTWRLPLSNRSMASPVRIEHVAPESRAPKSPVFI